jgi:hypothetical protein
MRIRSVIAPALMVPAIILAAACSSSTSPGKPHIDGTTASWYNGGTVTLAYTQEFACPQPPTAHSVSGCEAGSAGTTSPTSMPLSEIPNIYVVVPLYANPPQSTLSNLQCPNVGNCVDHPHDIDLYTYLGAVFNSASDTIAPLPAHSHVITTLAGGANIPWCVMIVGVLDSTTFNAIIAAKDTAEITALQQSDPTLGSSQTGVGTHISVNIPTNLFLFFEAQT